MSVAESHTAAPSANHRQPYPAYKDSGVEWLGNVPSHWRLKRLKYAASMSAAKLTEKPADLTYLGLENVEAGTGQLLIDTPTENVESVVNRFVEGDVLFGKLRPYLAKVVRATFDGVCTTEMLALHPGRDVDGKYLFYRLLSEDFINLVNSFTYGVKMPRVSSEQIGDVYIVLPSLVEQRAIAAFLDRETAKTDALIAKKERQIELLRERRAVFVSHMVTKGLDSSVPTKESGVEWLGDIPEHWEIKRLRFIAQVRTGVAKGRNVVLAETVQLPYLRVANVQDGYLNLEDVATITVGADEVTRYALKQGDVLMNEGGDFDKLGRGAVWSGQISPCLHQNHVFAVRPRRGTDPHWLAAVTSTSYAKHYFIINSRQSTNLASISSTNLAELPVVMPPFEERSAILKRIEAETARIDALITKVQEHIDKLREHRTALISAAVTGKIDVREDVV